jgi:hypothetical protein
LKRDPLFEFSKEMILRLISGHICVAVLFPYGGDILVEPALEEAFQGPDSGQYDDEQEPKNIT